MLSEYRARLTGGLRETLERAAKLGMLGNSAEIDAQIDHALGFVQTFESSLGRPPYSVLDLGSGGGLPGLVLHQAWPETEVVLLEANERRVEFLKSELARSGANGPLAAGPVEVVRGRAEAVAHQIRYRERFEGVSSRSFGPPAVVAECGAPFLATRGSWWSRSRPTRMRARAGRRRALPRSDSVRERPPAPTIGSTTGSCRNSEPHRTGSRAEMGSPRSDLSSEPLRFPRRSAERD